MKKASEVLPIVEKWQLQLDELYISMEAKRTYSRNDKAVLKKIVKQITDFIGE